MNNGKALFAQFMDFQPWTSFARLVNRYGGNRYVKSPTWADMTALLIRRARKLYATESLATELDNTVYCLDSTTIDLCLSLFEWARFRATKAA